MGQRSDARSRVDVKALDGAGNGSLPHRARYYSPTYQRFISEDSIGYLAGDPNFYVYVGDAPTVFTDTLGLEGSGAAPGGMALRGIP
ncbi:MAG: RHS repeat-associated core domain-containing protein [Actinomycetota bacterium]